MDKKIFILSHAAARQNALNAVISAPDGFAVIIRERDRSLDQNAAQWPILEAFAYQLQWPVNGVLSFLTKEEWKDILTAAFNQENVRVALGINGGMVMLGHRTSKFSKKKFSEWLEFLHAIAAEKGVIVCQDQKRDGEFK